MCDTCMCRAVALARAGKMGEIVCVFFYQLIVSIPIIAVFGACVESLTSADGAAQCSHKSPTLNVKKTVHNPQVPQLALFCNCAS